MDDAERMIKHLEMIQGVINRLAHNSFLIKGWSVAILSAGVIFIVRSGVQQEFLMLAFLMPVVIFWILDSYYLRQERLFRSLYDEVRGRETTDFSMDISPHMGKPANKRWNVFRSETLRTFYLAEIAFVLITFVIMFIFST